MGDARLLETQWKIHEIHRLLILRLLGLQSIDIPNLNTVKSWDAPAELSVRLSGLC